MTSQDHLFQDFERADDAGHVALARCLADMVLRNEPSNGPLLVRHAANLVTLHLYDEASSILDRASEVVPEKYLHLVLAGRGHLEEARGNHSSAEEQYLAAHRGRPGDATYLIYAACNAMKAGDIERAEDFARQSTTCGEGCVDEAWFNLGSCLMILERYEEAHACYSRALFIDPDYECAKKRLADVEQVLAFKSGADPNLRAGMGNP